jgi:hypothetical protein
MQTALPGLPIPVIALEPSRGGALLDELDDLITELATIVAGQTTARAVLADAESEMAVEVRRC